ncbi:MAG: DUF2971 domain-containing protein [Terriglobia bacterium]
MKTLPSKPPPVIYHYTNDRGLSGILGTGKIWLTDIFSLNDPSELRHGLSHGISVLERRVANGAPETKQFAQGLDTFFSHVGAERSGHYYICSFSSCGDDLGQWRAYADNGRGYAVGFDANVFENAFTQPPTVNTEAYHITYEDNRLDALLDQIIGCYLRTVDLDLILQCGVSAMQKADLYTWLTLYLLRAALFFKHAAYANEREYRFLQYYGADKQPPNLKLRARAYSLIKYREFDWEVVAAGALKKIVVGPAAHYERGPLFARDCLRLCNAATVPISRSEIPYRAG